MPEIVFHYGKKSVQAFVRPEETLLEAARRIGLAPESPCNGTGTCGKCKVLIKEKNGSQREALACITKAVEDASVRISDRQEARLQIKAEGLSREVSLDVAVSKKYLAHENVTLVFHQEKQIAAETGDTADRCYGFIVDIGTTTLVAALVDLKSGEEKASLGALNPQSRLAQDVLSRIRYASNADGLAQLQEMLIAELNRLFLALTAQANVNQQNVYEVVLSGNTCMLHLGTGLDPSSLGTYPYQSSLAGEKYLSAAELGLTAAAAAKVYLPPVISAYIGADITSGLIASDLGGQKGVRLFIESFA